MSPLRVALACLVGGFAIWLASVLLVSRKSALPEHLLHHPAFFVPDLLSHQQATAMLDLSKTMVHRSLTRDTEYYNFTRDNIGEAMPRNDNGTCPHAFLVPSKLDNTTCVLPGRVDIATHYVLTGGVEGLKERFPSLASRVQAFGSFMFDLDKYPVAKALFANPGFVAKARSVCPPNKQHMVPFQFNMVVQLPGQTVAQHLDAPYFKGADRFRFPQWLLVAMVFSGLFQDAFVDQVQMVAYFHDWSEEEARARNGQFVYWDDNSGAYKSQPPLRRAGTLVDGSKVVHAAKVYRPEVAPPPINKDRDNWVAFDAASDRWQLFTDGRVTRNYTTNDLRFSLVYRAKCFRDEADAATYEAWPASRNLELEDILARFRAHLVSDKGLQREQVAAMAPMDLAVTILRSYIAYPPPADPWFVFNYCALEYLMPSMPKLGIVSGLCADHSAEPELEADVDGAVERKAQPAGAAAGAAAGGAEAEATSAN